MSEASLSVGARRRRAVSVAWLEFELMRHCRRPRFENALGKRISASRRLIRRITDWIVDKYRQNTPLKVGMDVRFRARLGRQQNCGFGNRERGKRPLG